MMQEPTAQTQTKLHLLLTILLLLSAVYVVYSFVFSSAFSGLGGYSSEKMLGDGAAVYYSLLLYTEPT